MELPNLQMLPPKNLSPNENLQNAFCTQAGFSAEAVDRIWQDAQGNKQIQITGGVVHGY
jgi:hypothetical protein